MGLGSIEVQEADTAQLKSAAGDITVDHATGAAELTAGSGEVRVGELGDGAVIKNSNGDTWVGVAGGDVRLNSANGSIAVDVAKAGVVAKTANGDVRLSEIVRGSVALETGLGDLEVGIREGTAAWLDVAPGPASGTTRSTPRAPRNGRREGRGARAHVRRQRRRPEAVIGFSRGRRCTSGDSYTCSSAAAASVGSGRSRLSAAEPFSGRSRKRSPA